ncbi:MAG TPA: amidohydrolase family protein [Saprospiraceae bacterium]|nr:amidohydrolase family protein [Saprospiraceae bacterium]HNT20872.1 amidohydrolase family protein [Saprospiraceae bacterium]
MPLFHASLIYTSEHPDPLEGHVLETDDKGKILNILPLERVEDRKTQIQFIEGILVPGFVNAHCHLELSHMKNMIPTGTGLVEFIKNIVRRRKEVDRQGILEAIAAGEQEMIAGGIVAVGDISNVEDTFYQKSRGLLRYHSFVEAFDLLQDEKAEAEMARAYEVWSKLHCPPGHKKSLVPHAPYSVSSSLFELLRTHPHEGESISIHHQETHAENHFFLEKSGALIDFYQTLGVSLEAFEATRAPSSLQVIQNMSAGRRTLLVHNTISTPRDIRSVEEWNEEVYWVTCPNANLYIENQLPRYLHFIEHGAKMCVGTDSLASNWQLSILEELKTIQHYQSYLTFDRLIRWATLNGALALGFEKDLGSFSPGKTPGVVQIHPFDLSRRQLMPGSRANRLI